MDHRDGGGIEIVEREIAVGGNVHAVARDGIEAEIARDGLAIVREAAAGERARTERHHVRAAARFAQTLVIAREHFEVSQQIVRPKHRLRAPQMRVAGNNRIRIFRRQIEQRATSARAAVRARGRIRRAARAAYRAIPARCGCGRCESCPPAPPTRSFSLRMTNVWTSSSVFIGARRRNRAAAASSRIASNASTICAHSGCVSTPGPRERARERL